MKKTITFLFFLFCITPTFADSWTTCAEKIVKEGTFSKKITEIIGENRENAGEILQSNADEIRLILLDKMFGHYNKTAGLCNDEIIGIAKMEKLQLAFDVDGNEYEFDIDVNKLFDHYPTQTAIIVYNNRDKELFNTIKNNDIKNIYWSDECSDHTIADNLDDDAIVNIAGQETFSEYGGKNNEFFLDFEKGNNQRAFPGMLLSDESGSTTEKIVIFTHLPTAIKKMQAFAKNLENSSCGNQNLAVYLVSIAGNKYNHSKGYGTAASLVSGVPTLVIGVSTAIALTSTSVAVTAGTTALGATIAAVGGPIGWIVGGGMIGIGYGIAMIPDDIADIEQVYVLDGPYIIR